MQGGTSYDAHEIMLPYAGIIRIRFMGMISARTVPDTPASMSYPAEPDISISFLPDGPHKVSLRHSAYGGRAEQIRFS